MFSPLHLVALFLQFYSLLVFVWVLGSWFPQWQTMNWYRTLSTLVTPYINLFRGLRLQYGMFDLTAMAAMLVLSLLQQLVRAAAFGGMLR